MTTLALRPPTGSHAGPRGPAFGLGVSLLVHAAVLAWLMHVPAPRPADDTPVARMQVWLAPPRPARPAQPETAAAPPRPAEARAVPQPKPLPRHARPAQTETGAAAPARADDAPAILSAPPSANPDTFAVPAAASPPAPAEDAAPVVDLATARAAARQIAHEEGKGLVALPKRKPVTDPNAGRPEAVDPIERARKSDCRTAYAGMGILAVIPLVASAVTDKGCKW